MPALIPWLLAAALIPTPSSDSGAPRRIDVDCQTPHALQRAIGRAKRIGGKADLYVHGICVGNFVIDTDGITLRGVGLRSGLATPEGPSTGLPVLEVIDAQVSLRGIVVRGGEVGVVARGWNADVLLHEVDVHGEDVGAVAYRGAQLRLLDSKVHDGNAGLLADFSARLNLQGVTVSGESVGVAISRNSLALFNGATITNNRDAGLLVYSRSNVVISGSAFRENGQVHINADEWSAVTLLSDVTIGSKGDTTLSSLGAVRGATIESYSTPALYGSASALVGGSLQLGNTVLNGDLLVHQFANAHVSNATVRGSVSCSDGAEAICSSTTTRGVFGCPSPTCGSPTGEAVSPPAPLPKPPTIDLPRFEWPRRPGPPS